MFYKVSYNQGFCSLLGFGAVLKKKSQYLADRAGYCDFAFCYMCLFDAFFYRFQYVVENLIGVAEGDMISALPPKAAAGNPGLWCSNGKAGASKSIEPSFLSPSNSSRYNRLASSFSYL